MTPEPEVTAPEESGEMQLDVSHYIAALERKNSTLLRENTVLEAMANQMKDERDKALQSVDELSKQISESQPVHEGRVTRKPPKAQSNPRKKTH